MAGVAVSPSATARAARLLRELAELLEAELPAEDAPAPVKSAPRRRRTVVAEPEDVTDIDVAAAKRALRRAGRLGV